MSTVIDLGTLVGQRFIVEAKAGQGGMGTVFRARDILRGETVAIKLLHRNVDSFDETERFAREVQILAELSHPGIVSYVAHGVFGNGQPYLVMEWLKGEELSQRLRRSPMTPRESLLLIRHIAEALDMAHQRQIVHRDLKPSNLFLRNGDLSQVTILDFGIARRGIQSTSVTRTGLVIGTPEYMAPEQARGQRDIEASADIFSLGCVLYECLTGQPPFAADVVAGVLAKILFEPAPSVRALHPAIPESLDRLIASMLEKSPVVRLQNAGQLLVALESLAPDALTISSLSLPRIAAARDATTPSEQQLVSVLLSSVPSLVPAWDSETTMATPNNLEPLRDLQHELSGYGAKVEILADGSIVTVLTQRNHMTANDQASQAARCALTMAQRFPDSLSTLTTGRALLGGRLPLGAAFERSARLRQVALSPENAAQRTSSDVILLDGVTAGLLDARFEVRRLTPGVYVLGGERVSVDETRSLLGQPTPCVGRDRELAILDLLFAECKDESMARIALIIAPAGMGKSRLRHEFLRRLKARHGPVRVILGRGDPLLIGSPYSLLRYAVRQLCGISERDDAATQHSKLWQHVSRRLPESEVRRVVEFIGAQCGIGYPDVDSVQLRAARGDARIMTDQLHRAFIDLLNAECAEEPLLLILEDLHWSDAPTVRLIDASLRALTEKPLMVLALARPEIETLFPRLWSERRCQTLRLEGLSKKASERLVRQVLGQATSESVVLRIIEQSAGNPLFLEELVRAVAEGKGHEMPETVLAMLQSRVLRLDPSARRVLLGASIFGQTFRREGLKAILAAEPGTIDVDRWLQRLVEAEILEAQREGMLSGDSEYRFRHALLRDAAYSLLPAENQHLGHRLAVQYLEQTDDSDPGVLAEHCELGNDLPRAGSLHLRAAERAHRRGDTDTAVAQARRGLDCGPDEIARLGLLVVLCQVYLWRNQWAEAAEFGEEVMRLSAPGSPSWAIAATAKLVDARYVHRDRFLSALDAVVQVEPEIDAVSTMAFALAIGIYLLESAGEFSLAKSCLQRLHDIVEPVAEYNPIACAWMNRVHGHSEAWVHENPWSGLRYAEATRANFLEAGHNRGALDAQVFIGMNAWFLGATERAESELRATLAIGEDLGLVSSLRAILFVQILCERGALDEAEREAQALLEVNQATYLTRGRGLWARGEVLYCRGAYAEAEQSLQEALRLIAEAPLDCAAAQGLLARVQLAAGRPSDALATAREAMHRFRVLGSFGFRGARAQLAYAEALELDGQSPLARQVVRQALDRLQQQAERIGDSYLRKSYLETVPEHRQLFALAAAWEARSKALTA